MKVEEWGRKVRMIMTPGSVSSRYTDEMRWMDEPLEVLDED